MTTGKQRPMREHPPTLLIVYLRPDHDEGARYHIDETLTTAGIAYRLIAEQEERVSLESAAPFVFTHHEKRMVFALRAPLDPKVIEDLARLVTTGLIFGFVVKGEITLGDEVGVINNLGGQPIDTISWEYSWPVRSMQSRDDTWRFPFPGVD